MTKPFSIPAITAILLSGIAGVAAQESAQEAVHATTQPLPSYEFAGLPITPHQMAVLGLSGQIRERATAPTLTRDGMPASPHQIAVLARPAAESTIASRRIEDAMSQVGPVTRAQ
jgi:hypothetical protein